jgi:hypothetical protein
MQSDNVAIKAGLIPAFLYLTVAKLVDIQGTKKMPI